MIWFGVCFLNLIFYVLHFVFVFFVAALCFCCHIKSCFYECNNHKKWHNQQQQKRELHQILGTSSRVATTKKCRWSSGAAEIQRKKPKSGLTDWSEIEKTHYGLNWKDVMQNFQQMKFRYFKRNIRMKLMETNPQLFLACQQMFYRHVYFREIYVGKTKNSVVL